MKTDLTHQSKPYIEELSLFLLLPAFLSVDKPRSANQGPKVATVAPDFPGTAKQLRLRLRGTAAHYTVCIGSAF